MTASSTTPAPQAWQVAHHPAEGSLPGYAVYQRGSHAEGTFIRVYVPELARSPRPEPLRRTLWPLLLILAVLEALSRFRRRYAHNLIHLLSTVPSAWPTPQASGSSRGSAWWARPSTISGV